MSSLSPEQPFEINAFKVARDVIVPEDLFSRQSVEDILADLESTNKYREV